MSQPALLLIRADADVRMGTGHLMRCLALAQAWRAQAGRVLVVLATHSPAIEQRLEDEELALTHIEAEPGSSSDASATIALAHAHGADWLVVDGYHFGSSYQHQIVQAGLPMLLVDDYGHVEYYEADMVLNQNITAHPALYTQRAAGVRLLLGTEYTLLRREFWPWRGWERVVAPHATHLLVTLGGSDPDNVTVRVLEALTQVEVPDLEIVVVVGGSNPHMDSLQQAAQDVPHTIRLLQNATHMPELMAWADLAIAAGGSTLWELAFLGVPTLTLILAANQYPAAQLLGERGLIINLGWHTAVAPPTLAAGIAGLLRDSTQRAAMARQGQGWCWGRTGGRGDEYI